jgi:hypothetical protein
MKARGAGASPSHFGQSVYIGLNIFLAERTGDYAAPWSIIIILSAALKSDPS